MLNLPGNPLSALVPGLLYAATFACTSAAQLESCCQNSGSVIMQFPPHKVLCCDCLEYTKTAHPNSVCTAQQCSIQWGQWQRASNSSLQVQGPELDAHLQFDQERFNNSQGLAVPDARLCPPLPLALHSTGHIGASIACHSGAAQDNENGVQDYIKSIYCVARHCSDQVVKRKWGSTD